MEPATQPELFQLQEQLSSRHRSISPIGLVQLRHDHAVLLAIGGLIGISVIFALGVERGKHIARAALQVDDLVGPARVPQRSARTQAIAVAVETAAPQAPQAPELAAPQADETIASGTPAASQPAEQESKRAEESVPRSGFAIQLVTYSQERLARKELGRLKQKGEPAFLITKKNRVVLCVGPFSSKENASAKLASMRQHYRDCFLRTL